jgi:ABC-type cobalamin/Fe3+-siderophores transport system ATPase subunit
MGTLTVTQVQIRDVLGCRAMEIAPGKVTVVSGKNAAGKSSMLQALQAALGRGSLASLARIGAAGEEVSPEVVLVLDGEDEHYRVERGADKVRVRKRVGDTAGYKDVARPQEFLSSLVDAGAANPVRLLLAPDKELARLLLEALPLEMDRARLTEALASVPTSAIPPVPRGLHPLEEVGLLRAGIFAARTGVNRDARNAQGSAEMTRRNCPAQTPEEMGPRVSSAQEQVALLAADLACAREQAQAALSAALAAAGTAHDAAVAEAKAAHQTAVRARKASHEAWAAEQRAEVERRIAAAADVMEDEIQAVREATSAALDTEADLLASAEADARADHQRAEQASAGLAEQATMARETLARLRAEQDASVKARALMEQAETFDAQAGALKAESEILTAAITRIDALARSLADSLPIPGLAIDGEDVRVDGIPWKQANTARRLEIAVAVACLRAHGGRLPLLFVDGAEALDTEHRDALVAELQKRNVQAFLGRVADHELSVETSA